jgi:hypothetical protein
LPQERGLIRDIKPPAKNPETIRDLVVKNAAGVAASLRQSGLLK